MKAKTTLTRRAFFSSVGLGLGCWVFSSCSLKTSALASNSKASSDKLPHQPPNIILCMADDMGWGDTGYNGHPKIKTPTLDEMSRTALRFDRWYAGAPVCSPTRGSCITGRHPYRYGIFFANVGHMKKQEITIAEALKPQGYTTGHFGKWHLGTLTTKIKDSNRGGPRHKKEYSPPWKNGFDCCFSTEAKVPTFNPMINPKNGKPFGTHYWTGPNQMVPPDKLKGDDSKLIMDRALDFIQHATSTNQPFLAVIWFHSPHRPAVADAKHKNLYKDCTPIEQNYFGCITAMDEQISRLRTELRRLNIADNTMLWFCSDNGPEGPSLQKGPGSAGPFRGRKRSLHEGGIRVPGLLEWPAVIKKNCITKTTCSTLDYYPTTLALLGYHYKGQPEPIDGINLLPLIKGAVNSQKPDNIYTPQRPVPICFESKKQLCIIGNRYKMYSYNKGKTFEMYDLLNDIHEDHNIASQHPQLTNKMKTKLLEWKHSCELSRQGHDYHHHTTTRDS